MNVTVRCFAMVRDLFGAGEFEVELPDGATLEVLRTKLAERAPDLLRLPLAHAVNQEYCRTDRRLVDGDEVAFIPPISGGGESVSQFEFVREPIDARALEHQVRTDHDGAVVTFAGVTRDHNEGETVRGLSYEAYEEMAHRVVGRIMEDARAQFDVGRIRVTHRLGDVPIGEASIVVVVASAHRGPAFEGCRFVMDRIKAEAPIFKREWLEGPDGESRWVGDLPQV
ncbi:MAG: molybdenum cofactor biosynthesis protein MoaE [Planctomycetes bacterium]|nr:molybdenum cofactor biosynthesis protein MoaE [Planctomycetota bacterium]